MKKAPMPLPATGNRQKPRIPRAGRAALLALALGLALALSMPAFGEFYKYTDENGQVHFVDDPSKIPSQAKDDLTRYKEKYDDLPLQERMKQKEKDSALRNQRMDKNRTRVGLGFRETRIETRGNSVLVPVTLEYRGRKVTAKLVLDTGAELMVIHTPLAVALGLDDLEPAAMSVAGGGVVMAGLGYLSSVEVGPNHKKNLEVMVVQAEGMMQQYEGLLGMNFLKGLDYTVDFEENVIRWRN